jgi:hypothetical protein
MPGGDRPIEAKGPERDLVFSLDMNGRRLPPKPPNRRHTTAPENPFALNPAVDRP